MTNIEYGAPRTPAQQIASTLANAAARQPNMPLIRAAVAAAHPELDEAQQDLLADQVAAEMRRGVAVGVPTRAYGVATADLTKAGR